MDLESTTDQTNWETYILSITSRKWLVFAYENVATVAATFVLGDDFRTCRWDKEINNPN